MDNYVVVVLILTKNWESFLFIGILLRYTSNDIIFSFLSLCLFGVCVWGFDLLPW